MPPKRSASASDGLNGDGSGFIGGDEFTRAVRKRLSTSTRTGQACDRCKVRKIRCDGLPGGCSPCIQNRTECKTTDRISQKAIPRGYLENLESKCIELENRNKELETALIAAQASARAPGNGYAPFDGQDWAVNGNKPAPRVPTSFSDRPTEYQPMNGGIIGVTERAAPGPRATNFRPGKPSTHYVGISAGNSYLSSMKETALSVLGVNIDLSALDPSEPANRNTSMRLDETYGSCLSTVFNINPNVPKPELPHKDEGMQYINYFFMISHPYLPILHRPTFMRMAERVYSDKSFEPTAAQTAMLHMVLAIVHFQNAASDRLKNRGQISQSSSGVMECSRRHYHYAISLLYELMSGSSLEDLQAIGLILQHLRAFPKPGGSWLLARMAVSMCLELGLHRSAKKWSYDRASPNLIEIELRKRVFWCILTLEVSLASRLGRPMSIREGDFDVEYPERIDDEYILENEILKREDGHEDCEFDVAIEMFKHATLTIQIHCTLYSVARPSRDKYVALVEDIEAKLKKWRDGRPKSLSLDSPRPERQFQAAHLHSWYHEDRILLRHPSLDLSPSPTFSGDCIRVCVESSREILRLTDNLRKGNHYLDTTWYGATVQLLATLTILFSVWDKRDSITPEEVAQVRSDMDLCMDVMGDLGSLLGSPQRLREVVQILTYRTMELLNQNTEKGKRASSASGMPSYVSTNPYPPVTTPAIPIKLPPNSNDSGASYSPNQADYAVLHAESRTSSTIPVYGDPLVPSGDHVYDTANFVPWSFHGNESWRQYVQGVGNIGTIENMDPSETYASTALIGLSQDCGQNAGYSSAGPAPPAGLALLGTPGGPSSGPPQSAQYPHTSPEASNQSWSMTMNSFTYAGGSDPNIRGGQDGGGTQNGG